MTDTPESDRRLRIGDAERDEALELLGRAHGAGRLDLGELADRQDQVLEAKYEEDLVPLLDDLPEGQQLLPNPVTPVSSLPSVRTSTTSVDIPAERGWSLAVLSGGTVVLDPESGGHRAFSFLGGRDIDVTDAMGPGRVVTLDLNAVMGGCEVYVPKGVRIRDETFSIMAGNDIDRSARGDGSNGTLVLRGFLLMAGNDVKLSPSVQQTT